MAKQARVPNNKAGRSVLDVYVPVKLMHPQKLMLNDGPCNTVDTSAPGS